MSQILVDTNVLIYAFNLSSPKHKTAKSILEGRKDLVLAHQNLLEFLRVVTHSVYRKKVKLEMVNEFIELLEDNLRIIYPTELTWEIFKNLKIKYEVGGNLIFDTYLVATMLSWGIKKIVTDNQKDLGKFEEIEVVGL